MEGGGEANPPQAFQTGYEARKLASPRFQVRRAEKPTRQRRKSEASLVSRFVELRSQRDKGGRVRLASFPGS